MRLLDKHEIVQKKNLERKLEIDEGAKLAKTIDSLRQTKAKEEANLSAFRDQSLASIKREVMVLLEEKSSLDKDIKERKEELSILRQPLDTEWRDVNEQKELLAKDKESFKSDISLFLERERDQAKRLKDIEIEEEEMNKERAETRKLLLDAEQSKREAKAVLSEANNAAEKILATVKKRELLVEKRELTVLEKERGIINDKKLVADEWKKLKAFNKQTKDLYQTLLRTQQRLKK